MEQDQQQLNQANSAVNGHPAVNVNQAPVQQVYNAPANPPAPLSPVFVQGQFQQMPQQQLPQQPMSPMQQQFPVSPQMVSVSPYPAQGQVYQGQPTIQYQGTLGNGYANQNTLPYHGQNTPYQEKSMEIYHAPSNVQRSKSTAKSVYQDGRSVYQETPAMNVIMRPFILPYVTNWKIAPMVFIFTILITGIYGTLYLGSLWDPASRIPDLKVAFLNHDAGFNFTEFPRYELYRDAMNLLSENSTLGARVQASALEPNGTMYDVFDWVDLGMSVSFDEAVLKVNESEYWGLYYIPSNFSQNFLSNTFDNNNGTPSVDAKNVSTMFVYDAPQHTTITNWIVTIIQKAHHEYAQEFANALISKAEESEGGYQTLLVTPRYLANPVILDVDSIHPKPWFGLSLAPYICCIILWISAMMSVNMIYKVFRYKWDGLSTVDQETGFLGHVYALGLFLVGFLTFVSASTLTVLLHAVNGGDSFLQGDKGWGYLLAYSWLACICFLSFSFLSCSIIGVDSYNAFSGGLMVFMLCTSNTILHVDLMADATHISKIFPFTSATQGFRCIFSGAMCHTMDDNYIIIIAWIVGNAILGSIVTIISVKLKVKRSAENKLQATS